MQIKTKIKIIFTRITNTQIDKLKKLNINPRKLKQNWTCISKSNRKKSIFTW